MANLSDVGKDDLRGFFEEGIRDVEGGQEADFLLGGETKHAVGHAVRDNLGGGPLRLQTQHQPQT